MNIQKFLGKTPRNPASPYKPGSTLLATKLYSKRVGRRVKETPIIKNLLSIHKKVINIENILKNITILDKKTIEFQGKVEKTKQREAKNKRRTKTGIGSAILGKALTPAMGALDFIKNFVTFTFLGWLFNLIQPHIDKLMVIVPLIQGAFDFLVGALKLILGGIGNSLKAFYWVKDNITGSIDKIKSQASNIQKTFDDTLIALSDVVNNTIQVATSFLENTQPDSSKVKAEDIASSIPALPPLPSVDTATTDKVQIPVSPIQLLASGGRVDASTPITRGVPQEQLYEREKILIKPTPQEQKTDPGRDVGGIDKIKELYKSETQDTSFFGMLFGGTRQKDGLIALTKTSKELKQPTSQDFLGLGNLMGASVDIALGQKPERKTYKQFADGIKYLVDYGITNPKEFEKMNLERLIENMVNTKVDVAISKIREEINKTSTTTTPDGSPTPDVTTPDNGGGGQLPGNAPPEVLAMLDAIAGGEGGWDSVNPGTSVSGLSNMTIAQARLAAIRKGIGEKRGSGAMGKFQQMPDYILSRAKSAGLDPEKDKFSPENQTKIARMLMASVYPGGEAQLIKDAKEDPLKASAKLRGTWPSLPGGTQENVHTKGFLSRYNKSLETYSSQQNQPRQPTTNARPFTQAQLTSFFGSKESFRRKAHEGIDIAVSQGTPLSFNSGGKILLVKRTNSTSKDANGGYGGYMDVQLSDGKVIRISHLSKIPSWVKVGETFYSGEVIAYSGGAVGAPGSGRSSGPHIHLEQHASSGLDETETLRGKINPLKNGGFAAIQRGGITREEREKLAKQTSPRQPTIPQAQQLTPKQKENITKALVSKGQIPFTIGDKTYYFIASADGSYKAYEPQTILGASLPPKEIDITGNKNKKIQEAIRQKINTMYPLPSLSKDQKMKKGGLVYEQNRSSLFPPQKYASYNEPSASAKVFIQPVIIQNVVPLESGNQSSIVFPTPKVNSSKSQSLIRS